MLEPILSEIVAMPHITGGGLIENLMRVIPQGLNVNIDYDSWVPENIFRLIQTQGNVSDQEMWSVFNMGVGMVLISDQKNVSSILKKIPDSWIIGNVTK